MLLEGNGIPGIPHLVSFSLLGWVLWLEGIFSAHSRPHPLPVALLFQEVCFCRPLLDSQDLLRKCCQGRHHGAASAETLEDVQVLI